MAADEVAPPSLTAAERRWGLAAAICSVAVFGLGIGEAMPLLSLLLEARGTDTTLTGLNAASAFLGVIVGPLLAPRCVRALGIRNFLLVSYALSIALLPFLKIFDSIGAWFALRVLFGVIGSSLFTATEAWINLLASDATRGRIIGLYAVALSVGFGLGPLLLSVTGTAGWAPFIANMALTAAAALPLLGLSNFTLDLGGGRGGGPLAMLARAPLILVAVAMFGLYETTLLTLLPVWGVRMGLSDRFASTTVSAVYIGAIAMQFPIGWLSDKVERLVVLRLCGAIGLVGAVLVIAIAAPTPALFVLLFVWGGVTSGIYPVALGMAGDSFRGGDLITVNAAIIMAYGVGSLMGPMLGGVAMDFWNPQGLLGLFVLLFGCFLLMIVLRWRHSAPDTERSYARRR